MPVDHFAPALLRWHDANPRPLPWRTADARADPYRIWLAEIMAQQTTVAAVIPYWQKFLARWPDVQALAAAPVADVLQAWAGLGYYARARNLALAAQAIAASGAFPTTAAGWQQLPGVGPYAAAAIAAITCNDPAPVIDTNVARVVARLWAVDASWPASRPRLREHLAPQVPLQRRGDFAEAMMDLGASICTPTAPKCDICPLREFCAAFASGHPETWPPRALRKIRPVRHGTAWWIECGALVALWRRPDKGLLGGMLALPGSDWLAGASGAPVLPFAADWQLAKAPLRHVFTHFELRLRLAATRIPQQLPALAGVPLVWVARADILDAGLPTLYRKLAKLALQMNLHMEPRANDEKRQLDGIHRVAAEPRRQHPHRRGGRSRRAPEPRQPLPHNGRPETADDGSRR